VREEVRTANQLKEKLRAATGLVDRRLDTLVGELKTKIADHNDVAAMRVFDYRAETAQEYAEVAAAIDKLVSILRRVHPAVRDGVGLTTDELARSFQVADTMAHALRKDVTKGRPIVEGLYRDGLARAAARIISAHSSDIIKGNLRRAVAAVLEDAGYTFPNLKKDVAKFDRMLRQFPPDAINEAAEREAKEIEERLGDLPI
jgi:hypothetical protein